MTKTISKSGLMIAFLAVFLVLGCGGKKPPEIIAGGGKITLRGAPLPHVEIRLYPTDPGLDGNYIASAISGADGKFTFKLMGRQESSVCVGNHTVTIVEGPLPEEARGESENSQKMAIEFMKKLTNRPIPPEYVNLVTSPLKVEIVKDKAEYDFNL